MHQYAEFLFHSGPSPCVDYKGFIKLSVMFIFLIVSLNYNNLK